MGRIRPELASGTTIVCRSSKEQAARGRKSISKACYMKNVRHNSRKWRTVKKKRRKFRRGLKNLGKLDRRAELSQMRILKETDKFRLYADVSKTEHIQSMKISRRTYTRAIDIVDFLKMKHRQNNSLMISEVINTGGTLNERRDLTRPSDYDPSLGDIHWTENERYNTWAQINANSVIEVTSSMPAVEQMNFLLLHEEYQRLADQIDVDDGISGPFIMFQRTFPHSRATCEFIRTFKYRILLPDGTILEITEEMLPFRIERNQHPAYIDDILEAFLWFNRSSSHGNTRLRGYNITAVSIVSTEHPFVHEKHKDHKGRCFVFHRQNAADVHLCLEDFKFGWHTPGHPERVFPQGCQHHHN